MWGLKSVFGAFDIWSEFTRASAEMQLCTHIRWARLATDGSRFDKLKRELGSYLRYEVTEEFSFHKFVRFLHDPLLELAKHREKDRGKPVEVLFSRNTLAQKAMFFLTPG